MVAKLYFEKKGFNDFWFYLRVGEKDPLSNIRGLGGGLGPLKLTSQNVLQFETHILGDNLERKRDVKNDYINLSYDAV